MVREFGDGEEKGPGINLGRTGFWCPSVSRSD